MIDSTGKLPGYRRQDAETTQAFMPPRLIQQDGKLYTMIHGNGLTTGVVRSGSDHATDRVVITVWDEPEGDGQPGMALSFVPDDAMLDLIIASLTRARDAQRDRAAAQATAAIRRAGAR